ncbi:MAG: hypothetical protein J5747_11750 [Spirochaetaceae bacterium]|nr:hypothetical protein [Spirochaetaceae bacterium]
MKNFLRISFLLFFAFALFVSCADRSDAPAIDAPLFSDSEASITISSFALSDLADGTWDFKNVYKPTSSGTVTFYFDSGSVQLEYLSEVWIFNQTFSLSGGVPTCTSGSSIERYTLNNENKAALNNYAVSHGISLTWDGNTVILSSNNYTTNTWINYMVQHCTDSRRVLKTNASNTRYSLKYSSSSSSQDDYYLKKR